MPACRKRWTGFFFVLFPSTGCFEIRYNLLNLASEVIGHDTEDTAAEGTLLCETIYYADGTRAGVKTPDFC